MLENYKELAYQFLNKGIEVETRLPCKVSETQFMWLGVYCFRNFGFVPGEHYRFWHVPGVRNCVILRLFIDFIHYCCNQMTSLVHLKQVNTKNSNL